MESVIASILDEVMKGADGEEVSKREVLGRLLVSEAVRRDPRRWAVELLMERLYPKKSILDVETSGDIHIHIDGDDADA
jgi:hypothetical protein